MKFGIRAPSLKGRITSRLSPGRALRHRLGMKAPRGLGLATAPQRAMRNRVYKRVTVAADSAIGAAIVLAIILAAIVYVIFR